MKKQRRTRPPQPGTLAAFVLEQPATMRPKDVATLARMHIGPDGTRPFPKCTPQAVYNARYHYGATAAHEVADVAAKVAAIRTRRGAVSHAGIEPELLVAVIRFGVDMTLRAVNVVEARADDAAAAANAAQRKATA
jgi:hypothetical protein